MIWNEEMETMDREQIESIQLERLKSTIERVYDQVPFYRQAFNDAGLEPGDVHDLEDLRNLPFTTREDLRAHYPFEMLAEPMDEVTRLHASSGTTGQPKVVGYTNQDIENWAEVCARSLACAGAEPGDLFHNAYGYGLFTGGLGMHYGGERMGLTVVPVSGGQTTRQVKLLRDFQARILATTPSYCLNIADTMEELGVDPGELALKSAILGAEPWTESMRREIEKRLQLKAVDIYGLSEVIGPGVACECIEGQHGLHIFEDHFLVEIVDPASGEVLPAGEEGELVFTSLTKEAFPVIRYRTGDISHLIEGDCSCGRTNLRMARIKGRTDDMLIIRGVNVYPSQVEDILLQLDDLAPHYQLLVSREGRLDRLEVHVEHRPGRAPADRARREAQVQQRLKDELGLTAAIQLCDPGEVPRSQGKAVRVVDKRD